MRDSQAKMAPSTAGFRFTELFHKLAAKADRQLDENEDRQKRSAQGQDGSEIRSVHSRRSSAKARPSSIAVRLSNSSAISLPPITKPKPAPPGGPARAASSAIAP